MQKNDVALNVSVSHENYVLHEQLQNYVFHGNANMKKKFFSIQNATRQQLVFEMIKCACKRYIFMLLFEI